MHAGPFSIDESKTFHTTTGGETVIISLENGCYYSLRESAQHVWTMITCGASTSGMEENLNHHFPHVAAHVGSEIQEFILELTKEGLISPSQKPATNAQLPSPLFPVYTRPQIEKFTDMQDLLLLDPIHDVDLAGWPHKKTGT